MMRKIKKKGLILAGAGICVAAAAITVSILAVRNAGKTETVSVGENQRIVYGYLTSVLGNEISYTEVETSVAEAMLEKQAEEKKASDEEETSAGTGNDSASEGTSQNGSDSGMPGEQPSGMGEGSAPEGTPPEMGDGNLSGETASGTEDGNVQDETSQSTENSMGEARKQKAGMQSGIESGESVTALIPVAAVVHTTTDTETTFSRLVAGDFVKLLLETTEDGGETIVEIWMVQ